MPVSPVSFQILHFFHICHPWDSKTKPSSSSSAYSTKVDEGEGLYDDPLSLNK